jgi:E3 ubiquitin-protein ligase RAD18
MWISAPFSSKNSLHSALHDFESSLRCPICHGIFVIPVNLLPCQHTFCSECIRRFLKASSKGMNGTKQSPICPFCRNDLCVSGNESRYLVPNRPAEEMVQQYKVIRSNLKHTLGQHLATNESHNASQVTSLVWDLIRSRSTRSLTALQSALPRCLDDDNSTRQVGDRKRRRATQTAATHVEPVLDDEVQVVVRPKRTKRPATYYNQLSLQKLREKCKQEGLSTLGNEKTLKARHQEYITLYNSECDSLTPRSPSELVREIAMRESARARVSHFWFHTFFGIRTCHTQ